MSKSLYDEVRKSRVLRKAWTVIHANGLSSASEITRGEIKTFAEDAESHIQRIGRQLRERKFKFAPSHGIPVKKKNKNSKRPLVKSPIPNRIVQRAILDVLQGLPEIKAILGRLHNFGGVEESGVPEAIRHAYQAARASKYFIRTDIQSFFVNIPRDVAIRKITQITNQNEFDLLLESATNTELDNLQQLGRDGDLFPLEGKGVAQGSCLSPLLCNLLLADFDQAMNSRGVRCIRYIDDFILFASSRHNAFKALNSARTILGVLGLDAYDPLKDNEKAECGATVESFSFLGCDLAPNSIRPSRESWRRLLSRLSDAFQDGRYGLLSPKVAILEHKTYPEVLLKVGNIIRGWGNTYAFCTDDRLMKDLDKAIDERFLVFQSEYLKRLTSFSAKDQRRILGIFMLEDCKKLDDFRQLVAS